MAAVEVRRLRSCRGRGIEKDFGQIWSLADLRVQSPAPTQARSPTGGTSRRISVDPVWPTSRVQSPPRQATAAPGRGPRRTGRIRSLAKVPAPRPARAQPRAEVSRRTSDGSGHWPTLAFDVRKAPRPGQPEVQPRGRAEVSRRTSVRSVTGRPSTIASKVPALRHLARAVSEGLRSDPVTGLTSHVQSPGRPPSRARIGVQSARVGTRRANSFAPA